MPVSEIIKGLVWWTLLYGGIGAVVGRSRKHTTSGFAYGMLLGPIGWLIVLLKRDPPDAQAAANWYGRPVGWSGRLFMRASLFWSVIILVAWVASAVLDVSYVRVDNPRRVVLLGASGLTGEYITKVGASRSTITLQRTVRGVWNGRTSQPSGVRIKTTGVHLDGLFPSIPFPWVDIGGVAGCWLIRVPLWVLLLFLAVPGASRFRRCYHIPSHCCQSCGYNLEGNITGTCPECGSLAGQGRATTCSHP